MSLIGRDLLGTRAPEFGRGDWANSKPLTMKQLHGEVVLVDIWTYSCVNCTRTLPHIKSWWEKYKDKGFLVVGVHSPEFEFEKSTENIKRACKKFGITYPVLNDATMETWHAYANNVWPRHFLVDQQGIIVEDHSGEGGYSQTEQKIRQLLGLETRNSKSETLNHEHGQVCYRATPETYLGAKRASGLAKLVGEWKQESEYAQHLGTAEGKIVLPFQSYEVNLVMHLKSTKPYQVEILLDGKPVPTAKRGTDLIERAGKTIATIDEPRMYRFINSKNFISGTFELITHSPDTQAFAFTFLGCRD